MSAQTSAHVSAAEAARLYGLSEKTVRRWIRSGRLRADKRDCAYSVALDDLSALTGRTSAQESAPESAYPSAPCADIPAEDVRPSDEPGADIMRAEAMAAYTRSLLEPLTAALERSQAEVAELRERAGRQTAELERAASTVLTLHDELAAAEASRRREHRRLRIGLAVAGALAVAAVVAPAWMR